MGLLSLGTPLEWREAKPYADHVREHGIIQLVNIWKNSRDKHWKQLLWGDEVEYIVVKFDKDNKRSILSLCQAEVLDRLNDCQELQKWQDPPTFHPEYGRFMIEATPGQPFPGNPRHLLGVEISMNLRREIAQRYLGENETLLSITSFPRLGCVGEFTYPYYPPTGPKSRSLFVPDEIINPHARFPTLTANIRERRGEKVEINVPLFIDKNTPRPFIDPTIPWDRDIFPEDSNARDGAAKPDHIYMDAMGFGMGCCCLQITFQATNIVEARKLYDQLAPLAPIMLALTAATPLWRGYMGDWDVRWNIVSASVDDRTREERGLEPLKNSRFRIPKSRYGSISSYISQDKLFKPEYNDLDLVIDNDIKSKLLNEGLDDTLASHFAHLFIRDPLVIFKELLDQDDMNSSDHFENIQSTNWQTVRFKPPPPNSPIGWRVEFRSMEVQITDFENAAYSIFIVLVTRAILSFRLNFYMPISKVDENMERAHQRDAVRKQKFWFRKKWTSKEAKTNGNSTQNGHVYDDNDELEEMTIDQIINGKQGYYGLADMVDSYLNSLNTDIETRCKLGKYIDLIRQRAAGAIPTTALWIREFVSRHPGYKQDSVVTDEINYDLLHEISRRSTQKYQKVELS